jgi:beta-mannosidase
MNYFHFALLDGWPAATWSVVSYDRVPKLGYAAVRRASQPILVGAALSRNVLSDAPDSYRIPLINSVFVANDTREQLPGARWVARLGGVEVQSGRLDVTADGVSLWTDGWQRWPSWSPPELASGDYELELTLYDAAGGIRSTNGYPMTVTRRGLNVPMPS